MSVIKGRSFLQLPINFKGEREDTPHVDILDNQEIRQTLPNVSDWPTFPQLFVSGELIGGCDIITEMHEAGELQALIEAASE